MTQTDIRPAARAIRGRRPIILICGKCLKRLDDAKPFRKALKAEASRHGKTRVVRTACLGFCPKRAVVLGSAGTLARGEWLIARMDGDVEETVARLLGVPDADVGTTTRNPEDEVACAPPGRSSRPASLV